jgi:hypothetical protein
VNEKNERQHYVSQVLLKRFKRPGHPLECYQVETGTWKPRSVRRTCSAPGYNQILVSGKMNNALEDSFARVETHLPETLKALEEAASRTTTTVSKEIYGNLCSYCAFLLGTSLFAKPGAVFTFLTQINRELEIGEYHLLRELKTPDDVIARFREGFFQGGRVIIESENVLQTVYRLQFERNLKFNYAEFLHCKWTIHDVPTDIPMSDIGLVGLQLDAIKAKLYILPISPRQVLEGVFHFDQAKNSGKPVIEFKNFDYREAEWVLDCICASAVIEVVCAQRNIDVRASRDRAKNRNFRFNKIVNPHHVVSAGLQNSTEAYSLQMVSREEYGEFIHTFICPPEPLS